MNPNKLSSYDNSTTIQTEPEDSRIIKIAKLVMILTSSKLSKKDKLGCLKLHVKTGSITQDEAMELLISLEELKDFV